MVHGPDNRHQIIELKGLDEHEGKYMHVSVEVDIAAQMTKLL